MTNEEKIISLLEKMDGRMNSMENRLISLEEGRKEDSKRLVALEEGRKEDSKRLIALEEGRKEDSKRLVALEGGRKEDSKRLVTLEEGRKEDSKRLISLEKGQKTTAHLLDIVAAQVNNLTNDVEEIKVKLDQKADKTDIVRLENEILPKIDILFEGQQLNSEKLDRIEKEVSKHEEVILRRFK